MDNKDCYSFDEERYYSGDLDEAVQEFIEQHDCIPMDGVEFTVHMGVSKKPVLEDLVRIQDLTDSISQDIYDDYGEISAECFDDNFSKEDEQGLQLCIRDAVKEWRIKNNFDVSFFEVNDVVEIGVRVTDGVKCEYEVINEH